MQTPTSLQNILFCGKNDALGLEDQCNSLD